MRKKLDLIWPGEILLEEFIKPLGISQNRIAWDIDVPPARINDIVHGRRAITADTELRLGKYFRTSLDGAAGRLRPASGEARHLATGGRTDSSNRGSLSKNRLNNPGR